MASLKGYATVEDREHPYAGKMLFDAVACALKVEGRDEPASYFEKSWPAHRMPHACILLDR